MLWIDEMNDALLTALREQGLEVVAVLQSSHPELPSFSGHDLYFGTPALDAFPSVVAPAAWIDDTSFRLYARCAQRMGFYPASDFMETVSGGVMLGSDVEDWARVHLSRALQLLEGVAADEVWFAFNPHLGVDNMVALAALRSGRKCLVFTQIRFAAKFSWKQLGVDAQAAQLPWKPWNGGAVAPDLFYMRAEQPVAWNVDLLHRIASLGKRLLRADWSALSFRLYQGARKRRWFSLMYIIEMLDARTRPWASHRLIHRRRYSRHLSQRMHVADGMEPGDFVYFPLHLEPEENVHVLGGDYTNQMDAIVALHAALPAGWLLILKENPIQTHLYRGLPFEQRLSVLPNVRFADPSFASSKLIERSKVVATITGTAGYEAMLAGKACLYFGEAWYAGLPGATLFTPGLDLEELASTKVAKDHLDEAVNTMLSGLADGLAHPRYAGMYSDPHELAELYREAARSMAMISACSPEVLPQLYGDTAREAACAATQPRLHT